MPVSFNFIEGPGKNATNVIATGPNTVTFVESDDNGGGQSVTFTVSSDASGGSEQIIFGQDTNSTFGSTTPLHLLLNDVAGFGATGTPNLGNDVFTLRFQDTAGNNRLTGSGTNAVAFNVGRAIGSISLEYLTEGGGTVAGGVITGSGTQTAPTALNGVGITGIRFTGLTDASTDSVLITSLTANALNCFTAGTRIATPEGEVAVESLKAGDEVLTADGSLSTVKWLGRQEVDVRTGNLRKINPICISAGALGENLPKRDLWVSQDHAIELDGFLVNAGALVNDSTIYQVVQMPQDGFTYYHVETDAHELLLAEGCPAESFVDYAALETFDNADEREGSSVSEMPLPRISAARMLPQSVKDRLVSRKARTAA
jgi:hypothetical protein